MNRRGFISMLAGAAGAPLVPWRGLIEPLIFLPASFDLERPIGADVRAALRQWQLRAMDRMMNPPLIIDGTIGSFRGFDFFSPADLHLLEGPVQIYESNWPR